MNRTTLIRIILTALFSALIAAGAFIRIPLPPVPITLQTLFALIAGLILPLPLAISSLAIYLLLGLAGLPVFTAGGGFAAFSGPTGGYLAGLVPAVLIEGLMLKVFRKKSLVLYLLAALLATVSIYIPGLFWLAHSRSLSLSAALAGGLYPFIIGDVIKLVIAAFTALKLRERTLDLITDSEE